MQFKQSLWCMARNEKPSSQFRISVSPRLDLIGVDVGKINASPDHQVGAHSMLLYLKKKAQQLVSCLFSHIA